MTTSRSLFVISLLSIFLINPTTTGMTLQEVPEIVNKKIQNLTLKDGLSQNSILRILQDQTGYLWLATQDGLNRYDGYNFKIFRNNPNDTTSLSENFVGDFSLDTENNLWVLSQHSLQILPSGKSTFERTIPITHDFPFMDQHYFYRIYTLNSNEAIITTSFGIFIYNRTTKKYTHYKSDYIADKNISFHSFSLVFNYKPDELWLSSTYGTYSFQPSTGELKKLNIPKLNRVIQDESVTAFFRDTENNIWISITNKGLFYLTDSLTLIQHFTKDNKNPKLNLAHTHINSISEDLFGSIWVGTSYNGFQRISKKGEIIESITNANYPSLPSNLSYSIFVDQSNILWMGLDGFGLAKLDLKNQFFRLINSETHKIKDSDIADIFIDENDDLWLGLFSTGIAFVNKKTNTVTQYSTDPKSPIQLRSDRITFAMKTNPNHLWVAYQEHGLERFNLKTKSSTFYSSRLSGKYHIQGHTVYNYYIDKNDDLWIVHYFGIAKFNKKTDSFEEIKINSPDSTYIKSYGVSVVTIDQHDKLYLGTTRGLFTYDLKTEQFEMFFSNERDSTTLSHNSVYSLEFDSYGHLWVGTTIGLNLYDPKTKKFKRYFSAEGLPNACIYSLVIDFDNNLWLTTNAGITKATINELGVLKFTNYDESFGLQSNEFNQGASFIHPKTGEIFVGGIKGVNSFFPDQIVNNSIKPPITITDFTVLDKVIPFYNYLNTEKSIKLSYEDYLLTFEFSSLDFTNPVRNQYKVKMVGLDKTWTNLGNRRYFTYTNLEPGEYTFKVIGSNSDGIWNNEGAFLTIEVVPPFWKTKLFYGFIFLFLSALIYGFIRWRAYRLEEINRQLNFMVNEKTAELQQSYEQIKHHQEQLIQTEKLRVIGQLSTGIAHDINNILSIIMGSAAILESKVPDLVVKERLRSIEKAAMDGATIITRLQDFSKNQIAENFEEVDMNLLVTEVMDMVSYKIKQRQKKESISISLISKQDPVAKIYGNASDLRSVVTNLLINSIDAFIKNGQIEVKTTQKNINTIQVKVQDHGKGIPKEIINRIFEPFFTTKGIKGSGLGLSQVYGILKRHGGTISVDSVENEGTTFILEIPCITAKSESSVSVTIPEVMAEYHPEHDIKSILVVEDEAEIRAIYEQILSEMGIKTYFAVSAEEGLELWTENKEAFDLILTDLGLPGKSGWDLIVDIRKENKSIPILIVTGWGNVLSSNQVKDYHVQKVLNKPFTLIELMNNIEDLLNPTGNAPEK